jgi:hypothetical protein
MDTPDPGEYEHQPEQQAEAEPEFQGEYEQRHWPLLRSAKTTADVRRIDRPGGEYRG